YFGQILEISGVRQEVEIDDSILRVLPEQEPHKIAPDKARPAGNEDDHRWSTSCVLSQHSVRPLHPPGFGRSAGHRAPRPVSTMPIDRTAMLRSSQNDRCLT